MSTRSRLRALAERSPVVERLARRVPRLNAPVADSAAYWEGRYRTGGTSGAGSTGRLAQAKAAYLNDLVRRERVGSVIEFGCGDGDQLALAEYPRYLGVDVAESAVARCRERFAGDATKAFVRLDELPGDTEADLTLSLDVVYHLVEDDVFERHVAQVFGAATRLVAVYSSPGPWVADRPAPHVRHRDVEAEVERLAPGWHLLDHAPNPFPYRPGDGETSFAEFFVYAPAARDA